MKKLKRSARLVEMTQYLLSRPHTVIPLTTFAERYGAAKSSISEDLAIIKEVFEEGGSGELQTLAGAGNCHRLPNRQAVGRNPTSLPLLFLGPPQFPVWLRV